MKKILIPALILFTIPAKSQQILVRFEFNKSGLTATTRSTLDSFLLSTKISATPVKISLSGHTDAIGSDGYNNRLSARRISAVRTYLISNNFPSVNILDENAEGERMALNNNASETDRLLNRRVEISYTTSTGVQPEPLTTGLKEKIADTVLVAGTNIVLRNINFYGGMHQFLPESTPMLEELFDALKTYPKLILRIEGHICCQPDNNDGLDAETGIYNLSEARARAVMDYLVHRGIQNPCTPTRKERKKRELRTGELKSKS